MVVHFILIIYRKLPDWKNEGVGALPKNGDSPLGAILGMIDNYYI